jgi:hypothetical protein
MTPSYRVVAGATSGGVVGVERATPPLTSYSAMHWNDEMMSFGIPASTTQR